MASIRPQDHAFVFEAAALVKLRDNLKLSQAKLAELLGVPVNTVSRWERGSNVPDANALAALFSIGKERGVTPIFFSERSDVKVNWNNKASLVIQWDYQNMPIQSSAINDFVSKLEEYIQLFRPRASNRVGVAYISSKNGQNGAVLRKAGIEAKNLKSNADLELIQDGEQNFGLPKNKGAGTVGKGQQNKAVYVLVANDGDYANYLNRLRNAGIEVFLCGTTQCSEKLKRVVDSDHFIPFQRPYVVTKCYQVARKLAGKLIHRGDFGNQCKAAIEGDGWKGKKYNELLREADFRLTHPFPKIQRHMSDIGILKTKTSEKDDNRITLTISQ